MAVVDIENEVPANASRRPEPPPANQQLPLGVVARFHWRNPLASSGDSSQWPDLPKSTLDFLNRYFISAWAASNPNERFWIANFYETAAVGINIAGFRVLGSLVVSRNAADLRVPSHLKSAHLEEAVPMWNANHLQVCKFATEQDRNYELVLERLRRMTADLF
jgi:hypothetical protein